MKREAPLRAIQRRLYLAALPFFLAKNRRCMAWCQGWRTPATQVHHTAGREGWLLCWIRHWLPVCEICHRWITDHGREAAERGWKVEVPPTTRKQRAEIEEEIRAYIKRNENEKGKANDNRTET
jgi:hypothetical protein